MPNLSPWLEAIAYLAPVLGAYFGAVLGSFVNVLCYRLPLMANRQMNLLAAQQLGISPPDELDGEDKHLSLFRPRSHCPTCKTTVPIYHLVPVVSYLVLRGKCHHCGAHIPVRYFLIELMAMGFGLLCGVRFGASSTTVIYLAGMCVLLAMAIMDYEHQYVDPHLQGALLWIGMLGAALGVPYLPTPTYAIAAVAGGWTFMRFYRFVFEDLLKRAVLFEGDEIVVAALGAWLGPVMLFIVLFLGMVFQIVMLGYEYYRQGLYRPRALIPNLALAAILVIAFRPDLATVQPVHFIESLM